MVPFEPDGEVFYRGQECPYAAFVLRGQLQAGIPGDDGARPLSEGALVGERYVLEESSCPAAESVYGVRRGALLTFTREALLATDGSSVAAANPELAYKLLRCMANSSLSTLRDDVKRLRTGPPPPLPRARSTPASGAPAAGGRAQPPALPSADARDGGKQQPAPSSPRAGRRRSALATMGGGDKGAAALGAVLEEAAPGPSSSSTGYQPGMLRSAIAQSAASASTPASPERRSKRRSSIMGPRPTAVEDAQSGNGGGGAAGSGGGTEIFLRNRLNESHIRQRELQSKAKREVNDASAEKAALSAQAQKLSRDLENFKILLQKEQRKNKALEASRAATEEQLEQEKARRIDLVRKAKTMSKSFVAEREQREREKRDADARIASLAEELDLAAKRQASNGASRSETPANGYRAGAATDDALGGEEANGAVPPATRPPPPPPAPAPARPAAPLTLDQVLDEREESGAPSEEQEQRARPRQSLRKRTSVRDTLHDQIAPLEIKIVQLRANEGRASTELLILQEELGASERDLPTMRRKLREMVASERELMERMTGLRHEFVAARAGWDGERKRAEEKAAAADERADALERARTDLERSATDLDAQLRAAHTQLSQREAHCRRLEKDVRTADAARQALATELASFREEHASTLQELCAERSTAAELRRDLQRARTAGRALACVYLRQLRLLRRAHTASERDLTFERDWRVQLAVGVDELRTELRGLELSGAAATAALTSEVAQAKEDLAAEATKASHVGQQLHQERWCYDLLARLLLLCQARLRQYEAMFGSIAQPPSARAGQGSGGASVLLELAPTAYASSDAPDRLRVLQRAAAELNRIEGRLQARLPPAWSGPSDPLTSPRHSPLVRRIVRPAEPWATLEEAADMRPPESSPRACLHLYAGKRLLPKLDTQSTLPWADALYAEHAQDQTLPIAPPPSRGSVTQVNAPGPAHMHADPALPTAPRSGFGPTPILRTSPRLGVLPLTSLSPSTIC